MDWVKGIDVSRWEGEINWVKVAAAGMRFAVIRATVGDYYTDPRFYSYWQGAKDAGLIVSAYHVVVPNRYASRQMKRFFDVMGDRRPDFAPVLDVERKDDVSRAGITACVHDCLQLLRSHDGRDPIIYTAKYFWKDNLLPSYDWANYDLWVANYKVDSPNLPPGWSTWKFWQFTESGRVDGINTSVDINYFNGTYEDLQAYANQTPTTPQPARLRARVLVPILNIRAAPSITAQDIGDLHVGDTINILNLRGNDLWVRFGENQWAAHTSGGQPYMELQFNAQPQIKARVLVNRLNIRSGPGTQYRDIGDLQMGEELTVLGIGGRDVWVEFEPGKWSAMLQGSTTYMQILPA